MIRFYLSLVLLFNAIPCLFAEASAVTEQIHSVVKVDYVLPNGVGAAGQKPEEREQIEVFLQSIPTADLEVAFLETNRPEIRVYIAEQLIDRKFAMTDLLHSTYQPGITVEIDYGGCEPSIFREFSQESLTDHLITLYVINASAEQLRDRRLIRLGRLDYFGWPIYMEPIVEWIPPGVTQFQRAILTLISVTIFILIFGTLFIAAVQKKKHGRDFD